MTTRHSKPPQSHAPDDFARSCTVFFFSGVAGTLLLAAVYLRPGPFGTPYVHNIWRGFSTASFYEWYGLALLSLPFFLLSHSLKSKPGSVLGKVQRGLHIALCFTSLLVAYADHEIQRYMGFHISVNYLKTYSRIGKTPTSIGYAIAEDPGGAYSTYCLALIPLLFLVGAIIFNRRLHWRPSPVRSPIAGFIGVAVFYIIPTFFWHILPSDLVRSEKISPPLFLAVRECQNLFPKNKSHLDIGLNVRFFQKWWKQQDTENKWVFTGTRAPLRKTQKGGCVNTEKGKWNFIVLQLETFRAGDMKLFNPGLDVAPTPFLDQLGRDRKSARWPRFYCNSLPTVQTFMSLHTGILPHTRYRAASSFMGTRFDSLPEILSRNGYHNVFFSGPDPDWDNERFWLNKWYDHVVFNLAHKEKDRPLFREAARHLKARATTLEPFFVTIVSITNHLPFRSPEPELNITKGKTSRTALHNTMRYTDDVVREFVEAIQDEPWFDRTVLVITGDHGYDLGDRGWFIGQTNLRHESTWVPLIIHGSHKALPFGMEKTVGSHIDIAPTLLELAGICDDNSFMGHSLIGATAKFTSAPMVRLGSYAFETTRFSAYFPKGRAPMVFAGMDILQRFNMAANHPSIAAEYRKTVDALFEVADYVYEQDRIVPGVNAN